MRREWDEYGVVSLCIGGIVADAAAASRSRPEAPEDGVKIGSLERADAIVDMVRPVM